MFLGSHKYNLKLGTEEGIERYDPIKIAALSAKSFRDAVERLSRYKQLTCPEEVRIVERGNESAIWFVWLLAQAKELPLLVDVCFAWIVGICQSKMLWTFSRPLRWCTENSIKRTDIDKYPLKEQALDTDCAATIGVSLFPAL